MTAAIFAVGAIYLAGHLFTAIFARTRVPDVLLLIVLGVLAGPVAGLVHPADFGKVGSVLSVVALVVLLFESGTSLGLDTVGRMLGPTAVLAGSVFAVSTLIVAVAGHLFLGLPWLTALLMGVIAGSTSPTVVIPLARGLRMNQDATAFLTLESALSDVLCIVLAVGILDEVTGSRVSTGALIGGVMSSFTFAALVGLAGGIGWLLVLDLVRRIPSSMFTAVAYMFILYSVSEFLGFSGGITALAFGLTISNRHSLRFDRLPVLRDRRFAELSDQERAFYGEVVFMLKLFFFFHLGLSVRVSDVHVLLIAILIVALIFVARIVLSWGVMSPAIEARDRVLSALMGPKGLAAAVLAGLPAARHVAGGESIQHLVSLIVIVSIVATAVAIPVCEQTGLGEWLRRLFARRQPSVAASVAVGSSEAPERVAADRVPATLE